MKLINKYLNCIRYKIINSIFIILRFVFFMILCFVFFIILHFVFFIILHFVCTHCCYILSRCDGISLLEVMLHVTLKVEVGKLILLLQLKQLGELGISVNNASIALVLKVVGVDIGVNLLANLSSCHLGTNRLS